MIGWLLFFSLACGMLGYQFGWNAAHHTVANECDRLGRFFVGKRIYECRRIAPAGEQG